MNIHKINTLIWYQHGCIQGRVHGVFFLKCHVCNLILIILNMLGQMQYKFMG
jgi:hypothetical protein